NGRRHGSHRVGFFFAPSPPVSPASPKLAPASEGGPSQRTGTKMARIDVGILGATGMVGQQFVALLAAHPWFRVGWLGASQRSEGKPYREAAAWRLQAPPADGVADLTVDAATPGRAPKLVFSGLDSSVAGE